MELRLICQQISASGQLVFLSYYNYLIDHYNHLVGITIVVDQIISEVSSKGRGITWSLSRQFENLDYTDDIYLLSHKVSNMQSKLEHLERLVRNVGLEIHINIKNQSRGN